MLCMKQSKVKVLQLGKKETQDKMANANRANANLVRRGQVKRLKPASN